MLGCIPLLVLFLPICAAVDRELLHQLKYLQAEQHVCDASNSNNSFIYCSGRLLQAVNVHSLFNDSKTFVDMPMKQSPEATLLAFNNLFRDTPVEDMDENLLRKFVGEYFSPPGSELIAFTPTDWQPQPRKLMTITDPVLRQWAIDLNSKWRQLCKKIDPSIEANRDRFSLIYVANEFIQPGGRFREFYYWDTYWTIKGLLACEMYQTTRSMILNLGSMVDRYGFVPNGGRVYYLKRSQPPMLSGMLYEYYESTNDKEFVRKMLPTLEKELHFWDANRQKSVWINGNEFVVYQYKADSNVPRPESYREDLHSALNVSNHIKGELWKNIASAAESGWDFSSRWFSDKQNLFNIETTNIVPADLNAFVCWNLDILEYLFEQTGDQARSEYYRERRARFRNAVHNVFYNRTEGSWFDYNLRTGQHNTDFYPSNAVPLFTGCYHSLNQGKSERIFQLMNRTGVFAFPGGVPTSLNQISDQQWDFPNGFSPLNHMLIEGLRKSENAQMQDQAFRLAQKWVFGNYRVYKKTKHMWEKYNVIGNIPQPGGGGEYDVQDGFGWTNGAILDLLLTYNDRLRLPTEYNTTTTTQAPTTTTIDMQTTIDNEITTRARRDVTTSTSSLSSLLLLLLLPLL